jgi:hypothetical protein
MMSDNQDLFDELRDAILAADNPKDRVMLLIMQRVLARVEEKLDDDQRIRDIALNGHADSHHVHHDQIAKCLEHGCFDAVRRWQEEEREAAATKKSLSQKFAEAAVAQAGTIVVSLIAAALGMAYLVK